MIKDLEQLNEQELSFVKDIIEKYLKQNKQTDIFVKQSIKKIDKELKYNNKDIKRLIRKINYLQNNENDYFITSLGMAISGILSLLFIDEGDSYATYSYGVFAGGSIFSLVINLIVNHIKTLSYNNIYKDKDEIKFIIEDNKDLEFEKQKLLRYKNYNKELKKFIEE